MGQLALPLTAPDHMGLSPSIKSSAAEHAHREQLLVSLLVHGGCQAGPPVADAQQLGRLSYLPRLSLCLLAGVLVHKGQRAPLVLRGGSGPCAQGKG